MTFESQTALALVARLSCAGILIQTLEVLWTGPELTDDRLLGWKTTVAGGGALRNSARALYSYPACAGLLALRAGLAAAGVAFGAPGGAGCTMFAGLVLLQLYYNRRFLMIAGTCETLFLVCLVAVAVGALPDASPPLKEAALGFVTLQTLLAYAVAGIDKLKTRAWCDGSRLLQIARDGSYPMAAIARPLSTNRRLARALSWLVLLLELGLPVALFAPSPVCAGMLVVGLVFHLTIAITMGLHGFWWAFAAAYPAVWFVHMRLPGWFA